MWFGRRLTCRVMGDHFLFPCSRRGHLVLFTTVCSFFCLPIVALVRAASFLELTPAPALTHDRDNKINAKNDDPSTGT